MRNSFALWLIFMLLLAGCKTGKVETRTEILKESNKNWEVNIQWPVFSSADVGIEKSCQVLNMYIRHFVDSLENNLKKEADTFFKEYPGESEEMPAFNYQMYIRDSVFMADRELISVRLAVYTFTGGAHGMTDFYSFNYRVKDRAFLEPGQIVDLKHTAEFDRLLQKNFKNPEKCFTEIPTLKAGYTAFNISPEAVCFTYPQYVLGPYSCGPAEVYIPRTELKSLLLK